MNQYPISKLLAGAALAVIAVAASAADISVNGKLYYNTDVVQIEFDLNSISDIRLWTDSWNSGLNFDPISALWKQSGSDYHLVFENDDNDTVAAGQGFYDTGMAFSGLAAGHYVYAVGASFSEPFAKGTLLSLGFTHDADVPTPIAIWNQPSYDINANDQKGRSYSIHLSSTVAAVPEPESYAMLLAGLGVMATIARRRRNALA